ncbi:alanine--tRNA ligase [Actinomyces vulturis]|uniref:alanine--tRNA ligase n=1 Tax=Actinomyces vulturis TaxID=1857645 RepID=UPI00082F47A6|nr:alanine--tRNA ligase [Actinomyces vulturis]
MRTSEIRSRWLDYFASNGHEIRPSVPLISPDPSILFTIAGMVPFIPYIIGTEPAPWPRVASVQKCIRTNDIDNVGKTTRHGTFFQMNGNFSFGDYFKEGAINYAWDLLTGSQDEGKYGLDGDRMWVTIWDQDDVSYDQLTREIGLDPAHIVRLPREENFWDTGAPGPAGPCAEWHYDRGPAYGPEAVGGNVDPGGDRYLELWNLVFDQYLRGEGTGKDYPLLGELDAKCIDTGAGLERLSFVLQDKPNMYEIDEVRPVITAAEQLSGKRYGAGAGLGLSAPAAQDDIRMRVVADHVRSALMLIGDGVRPGNDGRGYVLRRLIRRAVRSMRLLGVDEATLPTLLPISKDAMKASYPELEDKWESISDVAYGEEDAFLRTLAAGTTIFDTAVNAAKKEAGSSTPIVSGERAFTLHDTYGFPIDITLEMAAEQGVQVDEEGFRTLMQEQKDRARADALAKKSGMVDARVFHEIESSMGKPVEFLGYETLTTDRARVVAILQDGQPVPSASAPAHVEVVLDRTPFYAEMGGQLADQGEIRTASGGIMRVDDCQSPVKAVRFHRGELTEGTITVDEPAAARVDAIRRRAIARAHTATHMVHEALRENLGHDATQAGSENAPARLRFDFRHGSAVPASVMNAIEERVNERLSDNLPITTEIMALEEAKAQGVTALFGEKYGAEVRVVSIGGDWSRELCGGTHMSSTGELGRVTILGESSIGSGVRRVDALVADTAYGFQAREHALVSQISSMVGGRAEELPDRIASLMTRLKDAEKKLAAAQTAAVMGRAEDMVAQAERVGNVRFAYANVGDVSGADALRSLVMDVRERMGQGEGSVVMVAGVSGERPVVVIATNDAAREAGMKAGALVRTAAQTLGGGGGGKDDLAQGGGQNPAAIGDAIAAVRHELEA